MRIMERKQVKEDGIEGTDTRNPGAPNATVKITDAKYQNKIN